MGCLVSTLNDAGGNGRRPGKIGELAVFVPGLRIPRNVDFYQQLGDSIPKSLVESLAALRTRVVAMVVQAAPAVTRPQRKKAMQHGGSTLSNLLQALEDYLPFLLGLVKDGLNHKVQFVWANQEDYSEETAMANAWYEVLSVLHVMAMLCLSEANLLLLPPTRSTDGYPRDVSNESRQGSIDNFLKAAGYLNCAIRVVLPQIPPIQRKDLPTDLSEGVLQTFCMQALGQSSDIQLGIAIDSPKATLAVKRRLACEMVECWQQAMDSIAKVSITDGWVEKHRLFVKWKYVEAKAAAYYYHGLILDEGNTEKSHQMAVAALQAAKQFLMESKRANETFNAMAPVSRNPNGWGYMKHLSEKIHKDSSSMIPINSDLYSQERVLEMAPALPDFALALKPDDYQLPPPNSSWNEYGVHH
ncbi:uncharacterized protein [Typha latifolia]|uniref:uncharacterized protein isoform X1 n=1 Tax=Typha latifolia TaxID=4733 RepID=UPI003C2F672B